jgi:sugar lactone lactonase YvrE
MKRSSNFVSALLGLLLLVALGVGLAAVLRGASSATSGPGVSPLATAVVLQSPLNTPTPISMPSPVPTATPVVIPPPPDWPTDQPWPPPTRSPQEMWPTPVPTVFPTPAFPASLQGSRPSNLQAIWHPYFPDSNSEPQLRAVEIDTQGQRWGESDHSLELQLSSPATDIDPGPILIGLHPSPDSRWLVADFAYTGSQLVDLSTGKSQSLVFDPTIKKWRFLAWTPDSQQLIASSDQRFLLVDLATQTYNTVEFPKEEYAPHVSAVAYSPDGKLLADALIYPAVYSVRENEVTEIGLRNGASGQRKSVIQIPGGTQVIEHSLKWSPDGRSLIWIGVAANAQSQLWLADLTRNDIRAIETLGEAVEYPHPAAWSPDGHYIAIIKVEGVNDGKDVANNLHLFDLQSGQKRQLTNFTGERLSNVTWSPDGNFLAFAVAKGEYSEIWLTDVNGTQQYPIAGPASHEAPLAWLP